MIYEDSGSVAKQIFSPGNNAWRWVVKGETIRYSPSSEKWSEICPVSLPVGVPGFILSSQGLGFVKGSERSPALLLFTCTVGIFAFNRGTFFFFLKKNSAVVVNRKTKRIAWSPMISPCSNSILNMLPLQVFFLYVYSCWDLRSQAGSCLCLASLMLKTLQSELSEHFLDDAW